MNRRTRALQFRPDVKRKIIERDHGCIFCQIGFYMNASADFAGRSWNRAEWSDRMQIPSSAS